jgi:mRNA interferase RelE/StbE
MLKGGRVGDRRTDIGEYRIIYSVDGNLVEILLVGKRNGDEIYRLWERLNG